MSMKNRFAAAARSDGMFAVALFLVGALLLARLAWDMRPYPVLGWVDDYQYVRSAWYFGRFQWLGPFDAMTLVKRPFIAAVLSATSFLHLPYIQFQMFFFLAGVAFLAHSLIRLSLPRWAAAAMFFIAGFVPTLYDANGGRVLRETFTVGLEFFIFGGLLHMFSWGPIDRLSDFLKSRRGLAYGVLCGAGAFHWGLREEAALLSVAVLPGLALFGGVKMAGSFRAKGVAACVFAAGWLCALLLCRLLICTANKAAYGVFLVNDLSEGAFPDFVGALKSVREGDRPEFLVEPQENERLKTLVGDYSLIGDVMSVAQRHAPDLDYSHQMFLFRVSALRGTELGRDPTGTQAYFRKIARDIQGLCAEGRLRCDAGSRSGVIPRFTAGQRASIPSHIATLWDYVETTRHSGFDFKSQKTPGMDPVPEFALKHFEKITRQRAFGWDGEAVEFTLPAPLETLRAQRDRRSRMGDIYAAWSPFLYKAAGVALLAGLLMLPFVRQMPWMLALPFLILHAFLRVTAFGILSAIDGDLPPRLVTPIYPFALSAASLALFGAIATAAAAFKSGLSSISNRGK